MFALIITGFLVVAAVLVFAFGRVTINRGYNNERTMNFRLLGLIPLGLAILVFLLAATTQVQPKNIGVETKFGHIQEQTLSPGLHWKAPWAKVTELDGTVQTDQYKGKDCIPVRIGDGSQACVDMTHRWRIDPDQASEIFGSYRSNDPTAHLKDAVVSTELTSVVADILTQYNPVADLQVVNAEDAGATTPNFTPDYDGLSKQIHDSLVERYGDRPLVDTLAITISGVHLSDATQQKINAFIQEVAQTRISAQSVQTAHQEAAANGELAASVSNNPNVVVSKCFDLVAQADKDKYQLPAGFSCWPGNGSAVVVPSK